MYKHETPPAPPQNTPFPGLILKVGKTNYCLGRMDPIWAKCLKSGQNLFMAKPSANKHKAVSLERLHVDRKDPKYILQIRSMLAAGKP